MLFTFLNVEETARSLFELSATFSSKYKTHEDAIRYLKERAVELYERAYADVKDAESIADGVLQVPIWRNVGTTYYAVRHPNPPRGEEFPVKSSTPNAVYIEVVFWTALPLH